MNIIQQIEQEEMKRLDRGHPPFGVGDTLAVHVRVQEGAASRLQVFEGMVIAKRNRGLNSSFIVRKISAGEGVERTFQLYSPLLEKMTVVRHGNVKKARLYYLRGRRGRAARIKEKLGPKREAKAR